MKTITTFRSRTRRFTAAAVAALIALSTIGIGAASAWTEETLTEGWFLSWPSIAIDSDDHTNIVYQRLGTDPGLFLATNATGDFVEERLTSGDHWAPDVALDANDDFHVAFVSYGSDAGIHYLTNESASWVDARLTTGSEDGDPAIAVDVDGHIHIAYAASGADPGIFYLTNASGDWVRTRLTSAAHEFSPDLAVDANGQPRIVFARFAPEAPGLYYLARSGGTWPAPTRLTSSYDDWPALAIDSDGSTHVAFQRFGSLPSDGNKGQLFVASNETGSWVFERLDGAYAGFFVGRPAVAFDSSGVLHIVVREISPDGSQNNFLAHYTGSVGAWTFTEVPLYVFGANVEFPTIGFSSGGQLRVSYRSYRGEWAGIFVSTPNSAVRVAASRDDEGPSITSESDGTRHLAFDRANATGFDNGVYYGDDAGGWDFTRIQWGVSSGDVLHGTTDVKLAPDGSTRLATRRPIADIITNQNGPWERPNSCCFIGSNGSLAVGSDGKSHMATTSQSWVGYVSDSFGTWGSLMLYVSGQLDDYRDPAIAVDGTGRRYIWFVNRSTTQTKGLMYATAPAGANWPASPTTLYAGTMSSPDAAVDAANKVHVAWVDHGSNPGIYYATNASGSWVRTRLSRSSADGAPSIVIDANGKVLVAFARGYWAATPGMYLVTNRTGSWKTTLVSDDELANDPSLDVGPDGLADIAYVTNVDGVRVLAESASLAPQLVRSAADNVEALGYLLLRTEGEAVTPAASRETDSGARTTDGTTHGDASGAGGAGFAR